MRPVSDKLLAIVGGTHTSKVRVSSVINWPQSVAPENTSQPLQVISGSVRLESSAEVRGTCDIEIVDDWAAIGPAGVELFIEYGIEIAGGQTEWVSLGYFRVDKVHQDEAPFGPIRITGSDRMQQVVDTKAVYPWVIPEGTSHEELFTNLLYGEAVSGWFHPNAGVFPNYAIDQDIVFDYDAAAETVPYQIPLDRSFYEILQGICDTENKRMFFDYLGRLNVVDADVVPENPVVTLTAGSLGGTMRRMSRQISREGYVTGVRAEGSAPTEGSPPWGYSIKNTGDLSWYDHFGRVIQEYSSPLLLDNTACTAAAQTILDKHIGLPYELSLDAVANPALEPLDVITVRYPGPGAADTLAGEPPIPGMAAPVSEVHVIDGLSIDLAGGGMTITTRAGTKYGDE